MQDIIVDSRPSKEHRSKKLRSKKTKMIFILVMFTIAAAGAGAAYYFYDKYQDVKANPAQAQQVKNTEETQRVLNALKASLLVDETEDPTVARVEDPEKLKASNPEFYKNIQKGDYLIIFPKRAIVYREANDQIINLAPIINASELKQSQTEQQTQESTPPPANNTRR